MYRVIRKFSDKRDFNHSYKVGEFYPRQGMKVSAERLAELASDKNRLGTPLIELVPEEGNKSTAKSAKEAAAAEEKPEQPVAAETAVQEQPEAEEKPELHDTDDASLRERVNNATRSELIALAQKAGVEGAIKKTNADLKQAIIDYYGI